MNRRNVKVRVNPGKGGVTIDGKQIDPSHALHREVMSQVAYGPGLGMFRGRNDAAASSYGHKLIIVND